MSFIHQANINNTTYDLIGSCYFGTCDTAATTAAKVVTITNASGFNLVPGATVAVKFTNANSVSSPTLNVNNTGAISIRGRADAVLSSSQDWWIAKTVVQFIYDGTYWKVIDSLKVYAGATRVSLNGTNKGGSAVSIYAPTTYGESGYVLIANGSGNAPTWVQASSLETGAVPQRYSLTATAGQTSFSIPFDYDSLASNVTVYHNGILLKDTDNYTIDTSANTVNLVDYSAEEGDIITVMGLIGVAGVDIGDDVAQGLVDIENARSNAVSDVNSAKTTATSAVSSAQTTAVNAVNSAKSTATSAVSSSQTTAVNAVNSAKTTAVEEIEALKAEIETLKATIDSNAANYMKTNATNTMTSAGKITMNSAYAPSSNYDVTTKTYVDTQVATKMDSVFYVGTSAPSNTKLLWIDTSTGNGVLTYYNGSAWTRTSSVWA